MTDQMQAQNRPSIDFRTKILSEAEPLTVDELLGPVGASLVAANGDVARKAQAQLALPPLVLEVDGRPCAFNEGTISQARPRGALTIQLSETDLAPLRAGALSLWLKTMTDIVTDWMKPALAWDFVLRTFFTGRPLHAQDLAGWTPPDGAGFGLDHAFTPDEDDDDIARFISDTGFVRLRGWVAPELLPRIERELLDFAAAASRDEPDHLWATMPDGAERLVRVRYAVRHSPSLAALLDGPVYQRIGALFHDGHRRDLDNPYGSEALIKPARMVAKQTDLPWHRDCTGIACAYSCSGYIVGLPLTATNRQAGMLRVVAGSHRALVPPPGIGGDYESGLPVVAVATEPGDLTIHLNCTLHGTLTSTEVERTVVYINYGLPQRHLQQPGSPYP